MSEEDFSELVYNNKIFSHELLIGTGHYTDYEEKDDRLAYAKMDDDFVEIVDVLKLEDYK
jgi:thiazole synthase ThiGH ThiG subunit